MQTRAVKCPQCGGPLDAPAGAASVKCSYCGMRIALEAPAPAPRRPPPAPPPFVPQPLMPAPMPRGGGGARVVSTLVTLLLVGGVAGFFVLRQQGCEALGSVQWEGVHGAILADVNGDGVADVVGRLRNVTSGDRVWLAAFDGREGKKLWESEALGSYMDTYQGTLGLADDALLFAAPGGTLTAFSLRDGKRRWQASLPERAAGFCAGEAGSVRITLGDKAVAGVRLADGQAAPAAGAASCKRLADDGKHGDPGYELDDDSFAANVPGVRADLVLVRPGGPRVVFGTRAEGTQVPTIAVVYPQAPSRNWKSDLAGTRPLETGPFGPEAAAVTSDAAYTVYQWTDSQKPRMLVAFDLSGHRLWEAPLPNTAPLSAVQASDGHVYVSQWGRVQAYDAASGKALFAIGSGFP